MGPSVRWQPRSGCPVRYALLAGLVAWLGARPALAQDPSDSGPSTGGSELVLDSAAARPYWSGGLPRWFISAQLEGGFFYIRNQMAAGYGKPHWRWIGLETQGRASGGMGSEYIGLRAALPEADLRLGARYVFATDQAYLEPQSSFDRDDLRIPEVPQSHYLQLEAEVSGSLSFFGGTLFGLAGLYRMTGIPDGYFVFDETLHVVVDPPWTWRARGGHLLKFGAQGGLRIGMAAEIIGLPGREEMVVRTGPQLAVILTHHLDAAASIMAVAWSPDNLALLGADIGQFGLRYRWATGDPFPEFP
jgi:hypothetical protein